MEGTEAADLVGEAETQPAAEVEMVAEVAEKAKCDGASETSRAALGDVSAGRF